MIEGGEKMSEKVAGYLQTHVAVHVHRRTHTVYMHSHTDQMVSWGLPQGMNMD